MCAPAVHVVRGAGDVARLLAAQVGDQVGDVGRPALAAHRYPGEDLLLLLADQLAGGDVGVDQPGRDGVDRHAVRAQLAGQGAGEPELPGLGRGVGDAAEDAAAALGRDRRQEHDPAEAALDHAGREAAGDVVGAAHVHREDPLPLLGGDLQEGGRRGDAGVVDQRADRRDGGGDDGERVLDRRGVGDVAADADGLHAVLLGDLVGDVLGAGLVEVEYGDVPAGGGEGVGGGAADTALGAGAGDDGGAVSETDMGVLL